MFALFCGYLHSVPVTKNGPKYKFLKYPEVIFAEHKKHPKELVENLCLSLGWKRRIPWLCAHRQLGISAEGTLNQFWQLPLGKSSVVGTAIGWKLLPWAFRLEATDNSGCLALWSSWAVEFLAQL